MLCRLAVFIACLCGWSSLAANAATATVSHLPVVIERLQVIETAAARHERLFKNLRVKLKLEPGDDEVILAIKDAKCRLDRFTDLGGGKRGVNYWLDDGENYFAFTNNLLVLSPPHGSDSSFYQDMVSALWQCQMPQMEGDRMPVSMYCRTLRDLIAQGVIGDGTPVRLELRNSPPLVEVCLSLVEVDSGKKVMERVVSLDEDKNYVMTRFTDREEHDKGPEYSLIQTTIHSTYSEVAPDVYFLKEGQVQRQRSGKLLKDLGQERELSVKVTVQSVEIGDFEVEDGYFDVHKWPPIKKGINVHDARLNPPARFAYLEGPFDEQVLEGALANAKFKNRSSSYLLAGNLLVIGLIIVMVIRKRLSRA